jgi:hypothetical protein
MDLVERLLKKVDVKDTLDTPRKGLLCQGLERLSKDGACTAFMIIRAYKNNVDKKRYGGESSTPYYGIQTPNETDSQRSNITFEVGEMPELLLLILEAFLKEK